MLASFVHVMAPTNQKLRQAALDLGFAAHFANNNASTQFDAEQLAYIQKRASAYGLDKQDVINMMPPSLANNPDVAVQFLRETELSHIISQSTSPHLANDPSNILLEVADGTNQARGALSMSEAEILAVNAKSADHANSLVQAEWLDPLELISQVCTVLKITDYAYAWVSDETRLACSKMITKIRQVFSNLESSQARKAAADEIHKFITTALADNGAWAVALMAIALIFCPWLAGLLAARALVSLAKMAAASLRNLCRQWFNTTLDPIFDAVDRCLDIVYSGIEWAVKAVENAAKWAGDVLCKTYKATIAVVKSVYEGVTTAAKWLGSLFGFKPSYA